MQIASALPCKSLCNYLANRHAGLTFFRHTAEERNFHVALLQNCQALLNYNKAKEENVCTKKRKTPMAAKLHPDPLTIV